MIRYALSPSPTARGPRAASDQARGWPPRTRRAERGPHPRGQGTGGRSGGPLPRRMSGKPKGCLHRLRPVCRHRRHYRGVSRSPSWRRAIGHTRLPENTSPCNGGAKPVAHKPDCRGNISPPSVINLSCGVGGVSTRRWSSKRRCTALVKTRKFRSGCWSCWSVSIALPRLDTALDA